MPGHHDAGNEYTSLEDAQNAALYAKEQGLGGKYTPCWSVLEFWKIKLEN